MGSTLEDECHSQLLIDLNNLSLPNQLDETNSPFNFEQRQASSVPFSPTSPGKRSPGRPRTMKEYEEELSNLKDENFNLKVRIYFIEENRNLPKDVEQLQAELTDLRVKLESVKKESSKTENLLLKSYKVVETQKNQLETIMAEQDALKQAMQNKIDILERELKEYHLKFMETSVHLDDTNALYAMTFGLNYKPEKVTSGSENANDSHEQIKTLQEELEKEREKVMKLERDNFQLESKLTRIQDELQKLHKCVGELNSDFEKLNKERNSFKESVNATVIKLDSVESDLKIKVETLKQKEIEIEHLKSGIVAMEKKLAKSSQEEEKRVSDSHRKSIKHLTIENKRLKEQLKEFDGRPEERRELQRLLCESQRKVLELQKENSDVKKVHDLSQTLIQDLIKENKTIKREAAKAQSRASAGSQANTPRDEDRKKVHVIERMSLEKDKLISELYLKIEELKGALKEKNYQLNGDKSFVHLTENASSITSKDSGHPDSWEKDIEGVTRELDEKKKEVEVLKKELRKKTFNLQGLVNTELWDKNREIEKLNKACECKHLQVLALQKQLQDYQKTLTQEKVTNYVSSISLQNGLTKDEHENVEPFPESMIEIQQLREEKRTLTRKVEQLQARLLNTPERDTESVLMQSLRTERDQAEKLRKEAVNACLLLTTRLQELADFLDSLLPMLCGKKRKVVQQAVERSRELSRSLSLAAEDSLMMHCSVWTDLQPSLHVPLLPDISTVDFWSGEEEEAFTALQQIDGFKSQETLTEQFKHKDEEITNFQMHNQTDDSFLDRPTLDTWDQNLLSRGENTLLSDGLTNIAEITEGSLVGKCRDHNLNEITQSTQLSPEVRSANIGTITVSSRKKNSNVSHNLITFDEPSMRKSSDKCLSEYETWSEPDRDVSFARMGLKASSAKVCKLFQCNFDETSETADINPKPSSPRRINEIHRLQGKVHSLEQVNEALRSELEILHQLTPSSGCRQDKATSIEVCDQGNLTLTNFQKQLDDAEQKLTSLKLEKDQWYQTCVQLQSSLQLKEKELLEKQCALLELEKNTNEKILEVEAQWNQKYSEVEQRCSQHFKQLSDLQQEKEALIQKIAEDDEKVRKLQTELENCQHEKSKDKNVIEKQNSQLQLLNGKLKELQTVILEQEQLMADAERERQELATQLIARDRQVCELQKHLSRKEQCSNELESALRSQLDTATQQCSQFEAKVREFDSEKKKMAYVERIKSELEQRVVELEAANAELERRLGRPAYSDCDTDAASSVAGSPCCKFPPQLTLSTYTNQDLTSDYLSDHETALSFPKTQRCTVETPPSPGNQASMSPDLGIESDLGHFSSLEALMKSTVLPPKALPAKDMMRLEEENTQLRRNLQKTRHALEETLAQLTAANQHKRQYEAQLSAANQKGAKVEQAICRQIIKTRSILKKARVNLEDGGSSDQQF